MIKIERTEVLNMDNALRGMRNPMQSWDKSDSYIGCTTGRCGNECSLWCECRGEAAKYIIGPNDMKLAHTLVKGGSDERKFIRQIFVSVDITAPLYWWKEYDTYKVGTVANSTSTMHKIHAKPFTREDFSCERMTPAVLSCLDHVITVLEERRQVFVETKDKAAWEDMIQLLPTSFNQMRTCTLNYENLLALHPKRKNHKLQEWRDFCKWAETLPYFREMCLFRQPTMTP